MIVVAGFDKDLVRVLAGLYHDTRQILELISSVDGY